MGKKLKVFTPRDMAAFILQTQPPGEERDMYVGFLRNENPMTGIYVNSRYVGKYDPSET